MSEDTTWTETPTIRLARLEENMTYIRDEVRYIREEVAHLVAQENQRIGEGRLAKAILGLVALIAGGLGGIVVHLLDKFF